MNEFKTRVLFIIFIVVQLFLCFLCNYFFFSNKQVYESISNNKTNKLVIYEEDDSYRMKLWKNGKVMKTQTLEDGYRKMKDATWVGDNFLMISYVSEDFHTVTLSFDFTKDNAYADANSLQDAAKESLKKQEEAEKKLLEKEDLIKTKTGISLEKNSTIAVTFDYGKHWKDTGIETSSATYRNKDLRLSDDSYYLSDEFSYFYSVNYKGWLYYQYSTDAGDTWQTFDPKIAAFDAVWFKAGMKENQQPYFFMADKINQDVMFYHSEDGGNTFQSKPSNLVKDINLIYDTSYINDSLLFVTYYEYGDIFRSIDQGSTYEAIKIDNLENINQLKAPTMKDGSLQMVGIDIYEKEVIFTSSDQGLTWTRES
ncbi:WD40/YVTN/BNR-like repeat-containing protein [Amedibacillus sp. YH-ame10]